MKEFIVEYTRHNSGVLFARRVFAYSRNDAWNRLLGEEKAMGYGINQRGIKEV